MTAPGRASATTGLPRIAIVTDADIGRGDHDRCGRDAAVGAGQRTRSVPRITRRSTAPAILSSRSRARAAGSLFFFDRPADAHEVAAAVAS